MDVTLRRARPREVPLSRPSTALTYIPKALLRDDDAPHDGKGGQRRARWMPSEKTPGASKHLTSGDANVHVKLDPQESVSELEIERLQMVEEELSHLETGLDHFVRDFYIAAASFSAQANAQKVMMKSLTRKKINTTHKKPLTVGSNQEE